MKRILGVDFGTKNVGLALSDENGDFAYPLLVTKNSPTLLEEIKKIQVESGIETVVFGDSKNYQGQNNPIMELVMPFVEKLKIETGINVVFHPEFLTSVQAEKLQGKNDLTDASAATIMLQSYLDTIKNRK
jgi:putative Holliday junction resolvase